MFSHLAPLIAEIESKEVTPAPKPWKKIGVVAVGGVMSVGFSRDRELLLVISTAGRGVIDCESAQTVSRDSEDYNEDIELLTAEGIGVLANESIPISGFLVEDYQR